MSNPFPIAVSYQRVWRDGARHQLPPGAVWNSVDFLPNQNAPADKRGGWEFFSSDLSLVNVGTKWGEALTWAEFSAGSQLCAIDNQGFLYKVPELPGTPTLVGAVGVPLQNPFLHRNKLVVPSPDGTATPFYYDGTSAAVLSGAPAGKFGGVFEDYSVLAGTTANKNRVLFSNPGDPTTWDTTNSWWDTPHDISGLGFLRGAILFFSIGHVRRLRGTIPPAAAGQGSDFIEDDFLDFGCTDARSIAKFGDSIIWADKAGVYITDGATYDDLILRGGLKRDYGQLFDGLVAPRLVGGIYRNHYILWIFDGQTFVTCMMCDIAQRAWIFLSNIPAMAAAHASTSPEELYFLNAPFSNPSTVGQVRASKFSSIFTPSTGNRNDADGTAVEPYIELPFVMPFVYRNTLRSRPGRKVIRELAVNYELLDVSNDKPSLAVSYVTSPESTTYISTRGGSLPAEMDYKRSLRPIRKSVHGVGIKIAQHGPSSLTRLYDVELTFAPMEGNK